MRQSKGMIKQSGDVHPPELDDEMDEAEAPVETLPPPRMRAKPSWMPLVGLAAGVLVLFRLLR